MNFVWQTLAGLGILALALFFFVWVVALFDGEGWAVTLFTLVGVIAVGFYLGQVIFS